MARKFRGTKARQVGGKFIQYYPTREEIAEQCEAIQETWTEVERQRRNGYKAEPIEVCTQSGMIKIRFRAKGQKDDGPDR